MDWMRNLQEELSKTLSDKVSEQQPEPTPSPKVASTDRREVSEGERTKKTRSWIYSMPDDASDFEWMVEFIANCETHPLKCYEDAQHDVETMEVTDDEI